MSPDRLQRRSTLDLRCGHLCRLRSILRLKLATQLVQREQSTEALGQLERLGRLERLELGMEQPVRHTQALEPLKKVQEQELARLALAQHTALGLVRLLAQRPGVWRLGPRT